MLFKNTIIIIKYLIISVFLFNHFIHTQNINDINKMIKAQDDLEKNNNLDDDNLSINQNTNKSQLFEIDVSQEVTSQKDININFGYDFFNNRDSIKFFENLPAPRDYNLGPGDELILSIWGQNELRETFTISKEGEIYIDKVGIVNVGGRSIEQAESYLKEKMGKVYATLIAAKPSSYLDLSIGQLKMINVNFVGFVKIPGIYPIHPFSNLLTGIIQAGGIDTLGSLREVKIIRNEEELIKVDFYDYLLFGKSRSSMVQLKNNDVIVISPTSSKISIDGAIMRPAKYEFKEGEKILDILNFAGGPTHKFSNKISLKSFTYDNFNSKKYIIDYFDIEKSKSISATPGAEISLFEILEEDNKVELLGQVKSPGEYLFKEGMTILDLLEFGGGLDDSTYRKSVFLENADIIRRTQDKRYENVISFNLLDLLDSQINDILLSNLDKVIIYPNPNFFESENIIINGEVKIPGIYPLVRNEESLQSLINRSGGLTSNAHKRGIAIFRKNDMTSGFGVKQSGTTELEDLFVEERIRVAWNDTGIALMPGDSIVVRPRNRTIHVLGEVYNPGILEFQKNKSINYYIDATGGLTENGNNKGITIIYPNGIVKPYKKFRINKIEEGSTIFIPTKPPQEPFNLTQFATNWTSIISSMITIGVLSRQI